METDAAILCLGFKPNTGFAIESATSQNVTLKNDRGAILVDEESRTSIPNVFAVGDAACSFMNASQHQAYIPLATNAVRQALSAATSIVG